MADEPVVRAVCEAAICRVGYTPTIAYDGEHGLSIFGQQPQEIDLVLADVSMPKLHGIEMVRKIFELKRHSNVILMTGYTPEFAIPEDVFRICVTIPKPFTVQRLTETIRKCLESESHDWR